MKKLSLFFVILCALAITACRPVNEDHFAIYLLAQDIHPAELSQMDLSRLTLESKPIISGDDLVSYDRTDHTLELTQAAYDRVQQLFPASLRVSGLPFVVCVGKERIYAGAFWTPISSLSYDGVVIMQPMDTKDTLIQISLGYPGPDFFTGQDPRADARIMRALEQDGKLR